MFLFLLLMHLSWFCCSLHASCGAAIPVVHGAGVRSLSPRVPAAPEFRLHPSCAVWEMFLLEETGFALLEETAFAQLEVCKRGHGVLHPISAQVPSGSGLSRWLLSLMLLPEQPLGLCLHSRAGKFLFSALGLAQDLPNNRDFQHFSPSGA